MPKSRPDVDYSVRIDVVAGEVDGIWIDYMEELTDGVDTTPYSKGTPLIKAQLSPAAQGALDDLLSAIRVARDAEDPL